MTTKSDVLVIGAGPAGSISAAMIHKAGFSVRVVEREKFPRFVIGESLLPRCMEVLEDAGLLDAIKEKKFQEKFGAKFLMDSMVSDFNFSEGYTKGWGWTWQVTRADFDLALITEVQRKGVRVDFQTTVTGIAINPDESSVTTVTHADGTEEKIEARFIVDASGYGRVIPRLFKLEKPSTLDPRKAVFAHLQDIRRNEYEEPNRIIIMINAPGIWSWVIPFSNGVTSLGFVGSHDVFASRGADAREQFEKIIEADPYLKKRFEGAARVFEPRSLEAWSATSERFYGKGFVLTGNVTEFLDPVFSSGVMFATVSSHRASNLVIQKLKGENVDWETDYSKFIQQGVDTFRTYVTSWYDGTLPKIFFARNQNPEIKRQICSVLAGYVWDQSNPYVKDHPVILKRLVKLIDIQERMAAM